MSASFDFAAYADTFGMFFPFILRLFGYRGVCLDIQNTRIEWSALRLPNYFFAITHTA